MKFINDEFIQQVRGRSLLSSLQDEEQDEEEDEESEYAPSGSDAVESESEESELSGETEESEEDSGTFYTIKSHKAIAISATKFLFCESRFFRIRHWFLFLAVQCFLLLQRYVK